MENQYEEENALKKPRYNVNDIVYVNNEKCKIVFGPFERGFSSFYEVESNNQVFPVNLKDIKKKA